MALIDKLRTLAAGPRDHLVLPFVPANRTVRLAWLDPEADHWDDFPELDDVADELPGYVPVAVAHLDADTVRCIVARREAPHAVAVFEDGFRTIARSVDAFAAVLLPAGAPAPAAVLEGARAAADANLAAGDPAAAVASLAPVLDGYPRTLAADLPRSLQKLVGAAWTDLGVAHHALGDDVAALAAYRAGAAWDSQAAVGNLLTMAVDAARWDEARTLVDQFLEWFHPPASLNAVRATEARVLCELGDVAAATEVGATHAGYLADVATDDHALAEGLRAALVVAIDGCPAGPARDALRSPLAVPLPAPAPPPAFDADDVANALRLIKSGKVAQLKSVLTKLPALLTEPSIASAIAALPEGSPVAALAAQLASAG